MVALLLAPQALAEQPRELLSRMAEAALEQNYHGSFVYERTGSFTTHNIWRKAAGDQSEERMLQTDGEPNEWLRRNGHLVCSSSLGAGARWNKNAEPLSGQADMLHHWYSLQVLGNTRVADRLVTVLAVQPRDSYRYAYELYLDSETGLLLKSLLINERDTLLERFQFASLQLGEPSADDLQPGSACLPLPERASEETELSERWQPAWLPPGFALGQYEIRTMNGGSTEVVAQAFTDGLARFTLFIEPLGDDSLAGDLRAQLGPTVAVSRKLNMPDGAFLATVVGEIPGSAAERIAASLAPDFEEQEQ